MLCESEFTFTLGETWREPLESLSYFIESAEVFGNDIVVHQPSEKRSLLTSAQLILLAAACSCAHEIHWLLGGGYPTGAESRTRTLHELDVTARALARFGLDDPGLVTRYIEHRAVGDLAYFKALATYHDEWNAEPPDAEGLATLESQVLI